MEKITNKRIISLSEIENTIRDIRSVLTNDLVDSGWKSKNRKVVLSEHSLHAVEAMFHLLGKEQSGLIPAYNISSEGNEHWWLENHDRMIFDPTIDCSDLDNYLNIYTNSNYLLNIALSKNSKIVIERVSELRRKN